ncbi:hypothetical protein CEXT_782141 [Caerostris extrusa]|uniref:Secreted protein n=1 Tax=Caerostris extrusa TaxID=172846 RepID=A0AAV4WUS3_CAEEX|nr:hypothetical protein CEXT_782141 [Caerostris extrusa]
MACSRLSAIVFVVYRDMLCRPHISGHCIPAADIHLLPIRSSNCLFIERMKLKNPKCINCDCLGLFASCVGCPKIPKVKISSPKARTFSSRPVNPNFPVVSMVQGSQLVITSSPASINDNQHFNQRTSLII